MREFDKAGEPVEHPICVRWVAAADYVDDMVSHEAPIARFLLNVEASPQIEIARWGFVGWVEADSAEILPAIWRSEPPFGEAFGDRASGKGYRQQSVFVKLLEFAMTDIFEAVTVDHGIAAPLADPDFAGFVDYEKVGVEVGDELIESVLLLSRDLGDRGFIKFGVEAAGFAFNRAARGCFRPNASDLGIESPDVFGCNAVREGREDSRDGRVIKVKLAELADDREEYF